MKERNENFLIIFQVSEYRKHIYHMYVGESFFFFLFFLSSSFREMSSVGGICRGGGKEDKTLLT